MAQIVDQGRVGRKGFPRHWREHGVDAPMIEVSDTPASETEPVLSVPPTKDQLRAYAADARWRKETGGIDFNGAQVRTDRESQAMITGALALMQLNPSSNIPFKTATGFVTLDAPTVTALALAVAAHVQTCFAKEAELAAAIESGAVATTAAIDAAFDPEPESEA